MKISRIITLGFACAAALTGELSAAATEGSRIEHSATEIEYYTCTMHPSVRLHETNAKCPICSMQLVPVMKRTALPDPAYAPADAHGVDNTIAKSPAESDDRPSVFSIPVERLQMIGVTYAAVERKPLHSTLRTVGTVAFDKLKHWDYVARVDGYIQNLKVSAPGDIVEKGQVLMDIYSPDLVSTENEFLDLLAMRDKAAKGTSLSLQENADHLIASARLRLRQWNLSDAQIDALVDSRKPTEYFELSSPFRGVVQAIDVDQGRRVAMGDHLVDIVDLSSVWVWADFYQEELPNIKPGLAVDVTTSAVQAETFHGKVGLIDPIFNEMKHTGRVRIEVENPDFKLRPGMYVDAEVQIDHGEGLLIPFNAVLPTGKHNIVFVDKGAGKLEPRYIELGGKYGDFYAVTAGLKENERVVSSGNFLIDAESKIQGAVRSW